MMRALRSILLAGAAACLTAAAGAASAQTAPTAPTPPATSADTPQSASGSPAAAADASTADIIVTATRFETTLQNTPVAVTALSGKSLEQRGIRSLQDVASYTPNLTVGTAGGRGGARGNFNVRGIGSDAPDSAPSVGIYIDEVYYPSVTGNLLGLFDASRIEILRGPQGTLFGRNTIAGAVQYISVKPQVDSFSGFAEAEGLTLGGYKFAGAVNIPLGSTLALRIGGQIRENGGYVHDLLNNVDRGKDRTLQGRVQLRWMPMPSLTVDLKVEAVKVDSNGRAANIAAFNPANATLFLIATGAIPSLPPPFIERRPFLPSYVQPYGSYASAGFNTPDFYTLRYRSFNGTIRYDLAPNVGLKLISAYSKTNTYTVLDFDASPISISASGIGREKTDLFTQEAQLHGDFFDNRLHATTGVYYYHSIVNTTQQYNGSGLLIAPLADTRARTQSEAAYGQATFDITSTISATAGLRYSHETLRDRYPNGSFPVSNYKFKNTSPYFGLNWQVNPDTLLYAKASEGFRAGGTHLSSGYATGALYFRPETAWTYEAGGRFSFLDNRIRFNPTIFQTDWKDIQFVDVRFTPVGPQAGTQNAGDARLRGVELETQFSVSREFQLHGAFSYLDARYTKLSPPQPGTIPTVVSLSSDLPRSPKTKYTFGGSYSYPFDNGGAATLSANYSFTATQRSSTDGDQAIRMPHYGLVDARLEYVTSDKRFTFAVFGTNLADKYYLTGGIALLSVSGVAFREIGRPREVGGSVRVNF